MCHLVWGPNGSKREELSVEEAEVTLESAETASLSLP